MAGRLTPVTGFQGFKLHIRKESSRQRDGVAIDISVCRTESATRKDPNESDKRTDLLLDPLINNIFPAHVWSPGSYGKEPSSEIALSRMWSGMRNVAWWWAERGGTKFVSRKSRILGSYCIRMVPGWWDRECVGIDTHQLVRCEDIMCFLFRRYFASFYFFHSLDVSFEIS